MSDQELLDGLFAGRLGNNQADIPSYSAFDCSYKHLEPGTIFRVPSHRYKDEFFWMRTALWIAAVLQAFALGLRLGGLK